MSGNLFSSSRSLLCALLFACLVVLAGCGTVVQPYGPSTTVTPLVGEDLAGPCRYQLHFAANPSPDNTVPPPLPQAGVLVIFERADSMDLYDDQTVLATAQKLHFATLFAYQCDAASFNDIQFDATKGPGRALFQALTQFAVETGHPELTQANVVLSGFSAAGYLSMTLTNAYPNRVLGAVLLAPASAYANFADLPIAPAATQIPVLILAGSADVQSGTVRPLAFFQRGYAQGARWGFGVKTGLGHCCTDTIAPLLNPWVTGVVQAQAAPAADGLVALTPNSAPYPPAVQFSCGIDGVFDVFGNQNCQISEPSVVSSAPVTSQPGWLPDAASTQAWLQWVTETY